MKIFKNIIIFGHLAWIWLALVMAHIFLTNQLDPTNTFLLILDKIVFYTCFLVYPVAANLSGADTLYYLFILQFLFWLLISIIHTSFIKLVNRYAGKPK